MESRKSLRHILSVSQFDMPFLTWFSREMKDIERLLGSAGGDALLHETLVGKQVGLIFYPASSRTVHQFGSAARRLGAGVGTERGIRREIRNESDTIEIVWDLPFSSEMKGEYFEDSVRAFASAYDILVLRHFHEGYVGRAARILDEFGYSTHVINGGDGPGEHPTQALIDLWTILKHFGCEAVANWRKLEGLSIAFIGGNRWGRTVHSLAPLLGGSFGMKIHFVSPPELTYPLDRLDELHRLGVKYTFSDKLVPAEIFYVTRANLGDYDPEQAAKINNTLAAYQITQEVVLTYKPRLELVMHPQPRRHELPIWLPDDPETHRVSIDKMREAGFFQQMGYGVPVRMALLKMVAAPYVDLRDLHFRRWENSYTRQCICGRVESTVFGWSEKPQPPYLFLPKVAQCSFCAT